MTNETMNVYELCMEETIRYTVILTESQCRLIDWLQTEGYDITYKPMSIPKPIVI